MNMNKSAEEMKLQQLRTTINDLEAYLKDIEAKNDFVVAKIPEQTAAMEEHLTFVSERLDLHNQLLRSTNQLLQAIQSSATRDFITSLWVQPLLMDQMNYWSINLQFLIFNHSIPHIRAFGP